MIEKIIMFYFSGAIVIGAFAATMCNVKAKWRGKPLPLPRVFVFVGAGLLWPHVMLKLLAK